MSVRALNQTRGIGLLDRPVSFAYRLGLLPVFFALAGSLGSIGVALNVRIAVAAFKRNDPFALRRGIAGIAFNHESV